LLSAQLQQEERKAPVPKVNMGIVRNSSKNLYDNREERKEGRLNAGAQVMANARGGGTGMRPPASNGLNQFANAPQYTRQGANASRPNQGFVRQGSIPMARGPSAEPVNRNANRQQNNTGMGQRQPSAGRYNNQSTNAPFATGGSMNQ